ncbi:hypothetical protein [Paenibacillus hexagrammi]|uniref:Uncharacterized protein n=1 Tax=Paenibacillus hexagrammi TaxID=2908839 RepID=A0ABY3SKV4_9BACL|nr:hypothetical protein [Paenibacillus sp. YPD9-1]UJF34586.1 hypothetical protein L0M14_05255 [Paenibacillus sp. YPD9-1]
MFRYIKIGNLNVSFKVETMFGKNYFEEELQEFESGSPSDVKAYYEIKPIKDNGNKLSDNAQFLGTTYVRDESKLYIIKNGKLSKRRQIELSKENNSIVKYYVTEPSLLFDKMYRLLSKDYLSFSETSMKDFIYSILEPTFQEIQVFHGQSFMHGALLVNDKNEGLLATGWGERKKFNSYNINGKRVENWKR